MFIGENPTHMDKDIDIAPVVLMPGDPLRAKWIAETFLDDAKLVTDVRNMFGYTGTYKGNKVTIMGSGMGMPSASIYVFELIHYFGVKKIIRIGSCGAIDPSVEIGEVILADRVHSESNFAYTYNNYEQDVVEASKELNDNIIEAAKENMIGIHIGMLTTMDVFGPYIDFQRVIDRIPKEYEILGEEMEAFGLIHVANSMGSQATAMVTVVDSKFSDIVLSPDEREKNLTDMVQIALDAIIK